MTETICRVIDKIEDRYINCGGRAPAAKFMQSTKSCITELKNLRVLAEHYVWDEGKIREQIYRLLTSYFEKYPKVIKVCTRLIKALDE